MPHLKPAETQRVRRLIADNGIVAAAKRLTIHPSVLVRVGAGVEVRIDTIHKLRRGLASVAQAQTGELPAEQL